MTRVLCDCGTPLSLPLLPPRPKDGPGDVLPSPRTSASDPSRARATLGGIETPLQRWRDQDVWLKCDHQLPTGSFKDRGAEVLVALALDVGASHLVVDSSGNAGAALAAHAAHAGLDCTVFTPATTSAGKQRQISCHGARLELVEGPRDESQTAALAFAARSGAIYAGHGTNPFFLDGTKSWVYEVVRRLEDVDSVVLPVGSGTLMLGVVRGLRELMGSGWIARLPEITLAQTVGFGTLRSGYKPEPQARAPLAEGIAISRPARQAEMLDLVEEMGMTVVVVTNDEISQAQRELALDGYCVEPTSAVAWAAYRRTHPRGRTVVALTGNGLKSLAE